MLLVAMYCRNSNAFMIFAVPKHILKPCVTWIAKILAQTLQKIFSSFYENKENKCLKLKVSMAHFLPLPRNSTSHACDWEFPYSLPTDIHYRKKQSRIHFLRSPLSLLTAKLHSMAIQVEVRLCSVKHSWKSRLMLHKCFYVFSTLQ